MTVSLVVSAKSRIVVFYGASVRNVKNGYADPPMELAGLSATKRLEVPNGQAGRGDLTPTGLTASERAPFDQKRRGKLVIAMLPTVEERPVYAPD
jgi:hypothetical protein